MRRSIPAWIACAFLLLGSGRAFAQHPNNCDATGDVPDLIVGDIQGVARNGRIGDITAYSVGATSCNIGTCLLDWYEVGTRHPLIGMNMYRLKAGRFEHVGQSWLKHSFGTVNGQLCFNDCQGTSGSTLGVHCSDPYDTTTNGSQARLGPKWEVNASTGGYIWPFAFRNVGGNAIYKRLQVHDADLDPDFNAGAQYYIESTYTYTDDAPLRDSLPDGNADGLDDFDAADNSLNNSSYRRVTITESAPNSFVFNAALALSTVPQKPAIYAWSAADAGVLIKEVVAPADGRFLVGSRATDNGNGTWHYEYAVLNHSSHISASSFSVPIPFASNVTNVGFHDVDYHSESTDGTGSYYDPSNWTANVGDNFSVTWTVPAAPVAGRENALRWSTLYNFRFDADVPPASGAATLGLYRTPGSVTVTVFAPSPCDSDGACDPSETSQNCADCVNQSGGGGVCGDGTCNAGESPCTCLRDCGGAAVEEFLCADGDDNDCDGLVDCADSDCCGDATCDGPDTDGDGYEDCDCNPGNPNAWFVPGEVESLTLQQVAGSTVLGWIAPFELGATTVTYEVLRSQNPTNFLTSTLCVADGDPTDTSLVDGFASPTAGGVFYYEVRAQNACPAGEGPLGKDSHNIPRSGRSCP